MNHIAQKAKTFQVPNGTHDILPSDQVYWEKIRDVVRSVASFYGFRRIDTPIIEDAGLFRRSVGEATDIVEKQMYSFVTRGGDSLALRPEGTAPIVRSYIEQGMINLPQPIKLYYMGPMFRYESPQKGRYRQFHQFGLEVIGEEDAVIEAQLIQIFVSIYEELGLKKVGVEVNSMGCFQCRPVYKKLLSGFYRNKTKHICVDCRRRLRSNVLRLLDCKEEKCLITRSSAPQIVDHLCEECHNHFKKVLEYLGELEISYMMNPYLVRGLDYYTRTVFEFFPPEGDGENQRGMEELRQYAIGGGGRYDVLVKMLGGRDTPAIGAAAGIERIVNELKSRDIQYSFAPDPKVFLVQLGELAKKKSLVVLEEFRRTGISVVESLGRDSIKSQLKIADKLRVAYSVIIGQQEALRDEAIMREMKTGKQNVVKLENLSKEIRKNIKHVK